jgi:hypothetical protein
MPVGTYNPQLGTGASKLLEAFIGARDTRASADAKYGKEYSSEASNLATARKHGLEADQLSYAQSRTWKDIASGLGVTPEDMNNFESGASIDPVTKAKILRAQITNEFIRRGGGNAAEQSRALQENQATGLADSTLTGEIDPGKASQATLIAAAKPIFGQEGGQVMNVGTGETQQTPLSRAHITKLLSEGGGAPGTPEFSYDQTMGKGSWKKLRTQDQSFVLDEIGKGTPMPQVVQKLRDELTNPKDTVNKSDEEILTSRRYIEDNPPKIPNPKNPNQLIDNPAILTDLHYYDVLRKAGQKLRGRADPNHEKWIQQRQGTQPLAGGAANDPLGLR